MANFQLHSKKSWLLQYLYQLVCSALEKTRAYCDDTSLIALSNVLFGSKELILIFRARLKSTWYNVMLTDVVWVMSSNLTLVAATDAHFEAA